MCACKYHSVSQFLYAINIQCCHLWLHLLLIIDRSLHWSCAPRERETFWLKAWKTSPHSCGTPLSVPCTGLSSRCGDTGSLLEASHVVRANYLSAHYSKHSLLYAGAFGSSGVFVLMSLRFMSPVCTLTTSGLREAGLSLRWHTHRRLWNKWCACCWKKSLKKPVSARLLKQLHIKECAGRPAVAAKSCWWTTAWLKVQ